MGRSCAVPGCKSTYKNVKNNLIFKVPDETGMLKQWEAAIPGALKLKSSHFICKKHFEEKYIIKKYVKHDANGKIIAEVSIFIYIFLLAIYHNKFFVLFIFIVNKFIFLFRFHSSILD